MSESLKGFFRIDNSVSFPGTVEIFNDNVVIDIFRDITFKHDHLYNIFWSKKVEVIHGFLNDGNYISIKEPKSIYQKSAVPGIEVITFKSSNVIVGKQEYDFSNDKIDYAFLRFNFFFEWLNISGAEVNIDTESKNFKYEIKYSSPDRIDIFNSEEMDIYLWFRSTAPIDIKESHNLFQKPYLNLSLNKSIRYEEYLSLVKSIRAFYIFCSGYNFGIEEAEARKENTTENLSFLGITSKNLNYSSFSNQYFLIKYSDIDYRSQELFSRWFIFYEKNQFAVNIFVKVLDGFTESNTEDVIVRLVGIFERLIKDNFNQKEESYIQSKTSKTLEKIYAKLDGNEINFLKAREKYKSPKLLDLIIYFYQRHELLEAYNISKSDIENIIDLRHYNIHLDIEKKFDNTDELLLDYVRILKIGIFTLVIEKIDDSLIDFKSEFKKVIWMMNYKKRH